MCSVLIFCYYDSEPIIQKALYAGTRLKPAQQRLLSLVGDIEGGCIRLQPLELRHPLLSYTALTQQAYSHYTHSALMELVKLVGSANLLGILFCLCSSKFECQVYCSYRDHFVEGVWHFLCCCLMILTDLMTNAKTCKWRPCMSCWGSAKVFILILYLCALTVIWDQQGKILLETAQPINSFFLAEETRRPTSYS